MTSQFESLKVYHGHLCNIYRIGDVMVSVLTSSAVDVGQTKDFKIGICCLSAKHTALRSKSKDWLARNQNNVSEWSDMSTRSDLALKKPTKRVGLEQSGPQHHIIEN